MDNDGGIVIWVLIVAIVMYFFGIVTGDIMRADFYYKKGQVDAINGIIKYELIEKEDKTVDWQRIKE